MSITWKIGYSAPAEGGGYEDEFIQTCEDWGVSRPSISRTSQLVDTLTMTAPAVGIDEEPIFATDGKVVLYRYDGTLDELNQPVGVRWFEGFIVDTTNAGTSNESATYVAKNIFHYLSTLVYQQAWVRENNPGHPEDGETTVYESGLYLFQKAFNAITPATGFILWRITLSQQLADILLYAQQAILDDFGESIFSVDTVASTVPDEPAYAVSDMGTAIPMKCPLAEIRDVTCLEAIRTVMRYVPDAVLGVDYSQSPPQVYLSRRASAGAVSFAPTSTDYDLNIQSLKPRPDLVVPGVHITYVTKGNLDGYEYWFKTEDKFPADITGREVGVLRASVDLQGATITTVKGQLECAECDPESVEFWQERCPELTAAAFDSVQIVEGSADPDANSSLFDTYPRYLKQGQIMDWMTMTLSGGSYIPASTTGGTPVIHQEQTITAKIAYKILDEDGKKIEEVDGEIFTAKVILTNGVSGFYHDIDTYDYGEDVPTGLAEEQYASLSVLPWEGSFTLTEDDCSGLVSVGDVVNFTGLGSRLSGINALVQSVSEDLESGTTSVTVGPPNQLGISTIVELLRQTRTRNIFRNPRVQGGNAGSSPAINVSGRDKRENTTNGAKQQTKRVMVQDSDVQPKVFTEASAIASGGGTETSPRIATYKVNTALNADDRDDMDSHDEHASIGLSWPGTQAEPYAFLRNESGLEATMNGGKLKLAAGREATNRVEIFTSDNTTEQLVKLRTIRARINGAMMDVCWLASLPTPST